MPSHFTIAERLDIQTKVLDGIKSSVEYLTKGTDYEPLYQNSLKDRFIEITNIMEDIVREMRKGEQHD